MRVEIGACAIEVVQGDITSQQVDAIVTAANRWLRGGGGVDGAVHGAAGPELLAACSKIGGCEVGDAVATPAFGLRQARRVIHAVGPIYGHHEGREEELLARAHRRSLEVAASEGCTSVAFPAISCGVYGFPIPRAARVALPSIVDSLRSVPTITRVRYVLYQESVCAEFSEALHEVLAEDASLRKGT